MPLYFFREIGKRDLKPNFQDFINGDGTRPPWTNTVKRIFGLINTKIKFGNISVEFFPS